MHEQQEWSCSLGSSYIQVSANGETGIQEQLLGRLNVQALLLEASTFTYVHTYPHEQISDLLSQNGEQDEAIGTACVCVIGLCVGLQPVWPYMHRCIYTCAPHVVYVY